jgi:hydrogenase maturation factor HypF (carbamoyltransferase family)
MIYTIAGNWTSSDNRETLVACPTCHKEYTDEANTEHIIKANECLNCEHVRGEKLNEDGFFLDNNN